MKCSSETLFSHCVWDLVSTTFVAASKRVLGSLKTFLVQAKCLDTVFRTADTQHLIEFLQMFFKISGKDLDLFWNHQPQMTLSESSTKA